MLAGDLKNPGEMLEYSLKKNPNDTFDRRRTNEIAGQAEGRREKETAKNPQGKEGRKEKQEGLEDHFRRVKPDGHAHRIMIMGTTEKKGLTSQGRSPFHHVERKRARD
jgi:hypothetical protein